MEAIGNAIHQSIRTSIQSALAVGRIEKLTVALKDPIFSECYFFIFFLCFGQETTDANYPLLTASLLYDNFLVGDVMNTCCSAILRGCDLWKHSYPYLLSRFGLWEPILYILPFCTWIDKGLRPCPADFGVRHSTPFPFDIADHLFWTRETIAVCRNTLPILRIVFKWRAWTLNALR